VSHPDEMPPPPDGPTPAREQLPLPRRRRQSHLEPQLRTPGGPGSGTPFAAFAAEGTPAPATAGPTGYCADRAAAFHAGAHRGRSTAAEDASPAGRSGGPDTRQHATEH
jgi:hypothetical protein